MQLTLCKVLARRAVVHRHRNRPLRHLLANRVRHSHLRAPAHRAVTLLPVVRKALLHHQQLANRAPQLRLVHRRRLAVHKAVHHRHHPAVVHRPVAVLRQQLARRAQLNHHPVLLNLHQRLVRRAVVHHRHRPLHHLQANRVRLSHLHQPALLQRLHRLVLQHHLLHHLLRLHHHPQLLLHYLRVKC